MHALIAAVAALALLGGPLARSATATQICGTLQELRHPDGIRGEDGIG